MENTEANDAEGASAAESLTFKQRLFVEFYIGTSNGNASDAARRAGYKHPGQQGHRLIRLPAIKAATSARYKEAAMGTDEVLSRLASIARSSLRDILFRAPKQNSAQADGNGIRRIAPAVILDAAEDDEQEPYPARPGDDESDDAIPLDEDGQPEHYVFDIDRAVATGAIHGVRSVKPSKYGLVIEMEDRQGALDKIARAHGLYAADISTQEAIVKIYIDGDMRDDV